MPNNPKAVNNLIPFTKGDKRINRKGRPRSFDALRKMAIKIAVGDADPDDPESMTRVEKILRGWAESREREQQEHFVEVAYGKVPIVNEITGKDGKDIVIKVIYGDK